MATQWEVVGKSASKRAKNPPKALSKADKKAFVERMQRTEPHGKRLGVVTGSTNTYKAFTEDEPKESWPSAQSDGDSVGNGASMNGGSGPKKPSQKPSKPKKQERKGYVSLEAALAEIDVKDMQALLSKDQMTFPDNPLLWLKDLASYLNLKLENVQETDPLFEKHPVAYPLCKVPKPLLKMLRKVLDTTNFGVLELFFDHCINSMISDIGKGMSTYGFRIFIQVVAHDNPKITENNLSRYLQLIKTNQSHQLRCLSVMWAVGQPGVTSLRSGLRIWIDLMFPLLATRSLAPYAVTYLENIFSLHTDVNSAQGSVTFRDFFPIFDVIYAVSGSLPSQLQKRLLVVYPRIKAIAFTNRQDNTLRNFFPSFLARISPSAPEPMRSELTSCLMTCLSQDKHCFSTWRQMYTRHFTQSGFLLQRLAEDYHRNVVKIDKKMLIDTVKTFNVTNEDLAAQKKTNFDGFDHCNSACKSLLLENSKFRFPWSLFFTTSLMLIAGLVTYDMYTNRWKFPGSKTHTLLRDSGILAMSMQVWSRICEYSILTYKWLELNVPIYYTKAVQIIGPYLVLFWQKLTELWSYLMVVSAPARAWIHTQSLAVYAYLSLNVPVWYAEFLKVVAPYWQVCHYYLSIVWKEVVRYSAIFWVWLQNNVLVGQFSVDNLHKLAVQSLLILREYLNLFITFCSNTIQNITNS